MIIITRHQSEAAAEDEGHATTMEGFVRTTLVKYPNLTSYVVRGYGHGLIRRRIVDDEEKLRHYSLSDEEATCLEALQKNTALEPGSPFGLLLLQSAQEPCQQANLNLKRLDPCATPGGTDNSSINNIESYYASKDAEDRVVDFLRKLYSKHLIIAQHVNPSVIIECRLVTITVSVTSTDDIREHRRAFVELVKPHLLGYKLQQQNDKQYCIITYTNNKMYANFLNSIDGNADCILIFSNARHYFCEMSSDVYVSNQTNYTFCTSMNKFFPVVETPAEEKVFLEHRLCAQLSYVLGGISLDTNGLAKNHTMDPFFFLSYEAALQYFTKLSDTSFRTWSSDGFVKAMVLNKDLN